MGLVEDLLTVSTMHAYIYIYICMHAGITNATSSGFKDPYICLYAAFA